jgi:XTP/dITP diphosphohydrolase
MKKLLFATTNKHKVKEARSIYHDLDIEIESMARIQQLRKMKVDEIGASFSDNAFIKAKAYAKASGMLTIAEDSGLEVTALKGAPGVSSHRWLKGSDHDRTIAVLKKMEGKADRRARFISVVCLYDPQTNRVEFFEDEVTGTIAKQADGKEGFGYDPIFIPDGYKQTFAALGNKVKNKLSHRRKALEKLREFLLKV